MMTLGDLKTVVSDLTRHENLGDRVETWATLVWAEMATRLAGATGDVFAIDFVAGAWNATTQAANLTESDTWYGNFQLTGSLPTTATHTLSTIPLQAFPGNRLPRDLMQVVQIFHGSGVGSGWVLTNETSGALNQRYERMSPKDMAQIQEAATAKVTVASNEAASNIRYAHVGAAFSSGDASSFCQKLQIFPHPSADSYIVIEYCKAPTEFGDDSDSCGFLAKHPSVFVQGVMRYAWMYVGDVNNYILSLRDYTDGLRKVATTTRAYDRLAVLKGLNA